MLNRRFMLGLLGTAPAAVAVGVQSAAAQPLAPPPVALPNIPVKYGAVDYATMMDHIKNAPKQLNAFRTYPADADLIQKYINSEDDTYIDEIVKNTLNDTRGI